MTPRKIKASERQTKVFSLGAAVRFVRKDFFSVEEQLIFLANLRLISLKENKYRHTYRKFLAQVSQQLGVNSLTLQNLLQQAEEELLLEERLAEYAPSNKLLS